MSYFVVFCRISSGRATTRPGLSGASWRSPVRRQNEYPRDVGRRDVGRRDGAPWCRRPLASSGCRPKARPHLAVQILKGMIGLTLEYSGHVRVKLHPCLNFSIQFTWSVEVSCQIKSSNQTASLLQSTQSFISRASLTFPRSRVVPASSHSNNIVLNSSCRDAATIQNQCSDCAVTGDRLLVATGLMKDFLRNCSIFCTGLSGFLCNMSHFAPLNLRGVLTCLNQF